MTFPLELELTERETKTPDKESTPIDSFNTTPDQPQSNLVSFDHELGKKTPDEEEYISESEKNRRELEKYLELNEVCVHLYNKAISKLATIKNIERIDDIDAILEFLLTIDKLEVTIFEYLHKIKREKDAAAMIQAFNWLHTKVKITDLDSLHQKKEVVISLLNATQNINETPENSNLSENINSILVAAILLLPQQNFGEVISNERQNSSTCISDKKLKVIGNFVEKMRKNEPRESNEKIEFCKKKLQIIQEKFQEKYKNSILYSSKQRILQKRTLILNTIKEIEKNQLNMPQLWELIKNISRDASIVTHTNPILRATQSCGLFAVRPTDTQRDLQALCAEVPSL